jgi:XTP/dITP diphosphohydrolase
MKLCFATNNANKLAEIQDLLGHQFELVGLKDIGCNEELAEDQDNLEGNSLQKAQYVYDNYGVDCFADDTGLEVKSLNGEPGVLSARYAGDQRSNEDNMSLVMTNLEHKEDRSAQFRTVITLFVDGQQEQFEGIAIGEIIEDQRGSKGFGYDPIFLPTGYDQTFAEMSRAEKNKISHRGRAIQKLVTYLKDTNV